MTTNPAASETTQTRRSLILGAVAVLAMPAIVRATSLSRVPGELYELWEKRIPLLPPIPMWREEEFWSLDGYLSPRGNLYEGVWTLFGKKGQRSIYTDEVVSFRKRELLL